MTARHTVENATASVVVTVSTAHLTAGDNALLRQLARDRTESDGTDVHEWREVALHAGHVIPIEGGWLLRIYEGGGEEDDQEVQDAGFSEAFVSLIAFWRERDVGWVRLDWDAAVVGALPVVRW